MDPRVVRDLPSPLAQRLLGRQVAAQQKERDLEEAGLVAEQLDRVAAIPEDALVAVDEVIALRVEAVFMNAGSYARSPTSSGPLLSCRRSVARMAPSVIAMS